MGNIPFGNYPVFDPAYRKSPHLTRTIHGSFLAKCSDVVRPGGVIALITSRYTMDKQDSSVRRHLSEGSVLLGAIRLPHTTFKANAGTDVTTGILFLQKLSSRQPEPEETWADLGQIRTPHGPLQINGYFVRHPEMMLGRMAIDNQAATGPRQHIWRATLNRKHWLRQSRGCLLPCTWRASAT